RLDAVVQQLVHQPVVERQTRTAGRAPIGLDARPRYGEPVAGQPELGHQPHVVGVAAEVVARLLTGVAAGDRARLRDERVPDGRAAAVDRRAALDLVRRGGRTPA